MKRVALFIALLGVSGCARWTGVPAARRDAYRQGLLDQRLPSGVKSLAGGKRALDCRFGADAIERCTAGVNNVWFPVSDGDEGGQIDVPEIANEVQITSFWRGVDPASLNAFTKNELPFAIEEQLARKAAEFEPRWGLLLGLTSAATVLGATEIGGRVGLRRWFNVNAIGHVAVDFGYRVATVDARLGLRLGVELTRWTDGRLWGPVGSPGAAIAAFIGPRLGFGSSGLLGGVRTGLAFTVSDWAMAPVVIELAVDTMTDGRQPRIDYVLLLGVQL